MSYYVLRRVTYAAAVFVLGAIIWWKRKRKRREMWADEQEDEEVDFDWQETKRGDDPDAER